MSSKARKRHTEYVYSKFRVYWSATITVMSIILALLILHTQPISLFYCLVLTVLLIGVVLALKMRFLRVRTPEPSGGELSETESGGLRWRSLLISVVVLIALLSLPLVLARLIDPLFWFISLISYTASVSAAEVLFFLITRKG